MKYASITWEINYLLMRICRKNWLKLHSKKFFWSSRCCSTLYLNLALLHWGKMVSVMVTNPLIPFQVAKPPLVAAEEDVDSHQKWLKLRHLLSTTVAILVRLHQIKMVWMELLLIRKTGPCKQLNRSQTWWAMVVALLRLAVNKTVSLLGKLLLWTTSIKVQAGEVEEKPLRFVATAFFKHRLKFSKTSITRKLRPHLSLLLCKMSKPKWVNRNALIILCSSQR